MQELSTRRGLAIYLLAWLFVGCALGGVISLASDTPLANAMLFAIPMNLEYAFAAGYSAYYLCRAYPLGSRRGGAIAVVLTMAAMVSGFLWLIIGNLWNALCLLPGVAWSGIDITPQLSVLVVVLGVLLYGFAAAVHYLLTEFVRAKNAEQRELESLLMAQEAELRMLRTQIDPHFLFNSLNSISALTSQDPKAARRMTLELASFFRQSLGMEAHKKVTLGEEMVLIRHFLAIEQVRFGERLKVEEEIGEGAAACLVPPMIIQPLVENAVKHGICNMPEGGTIRISARRAGSILQISVANPVDEDMASIRSDGHGIGLTNVRQRLAGAYKHEAGIHWGRRDNSFGVDITMPAQTSEQGE
ncbi:GHKL domain-containing protein [Duganella sp. FT80W]|uniref:GHKL domain-containing protein n=1 Tax=Duganella guangzhouensis TaxID=2666084 RepID=A0A6I2KRZ0_9BURK|nr:sensor histidine kinase [Duganella guangzhouensis]MRW88455.1 GHKL domain-containing protein [Duganella guangzhouensis]